MGSVRLAKAIDGNSVSKLTSPTISLLGKRTSSPEGLSHDDHDFFWRIWTIHHEYLFGLSLRWMRGNRADAEDALSTVKLKAISHLDSRAEVILNERAWLSRLLYNVCMDFYRRRGHGGQAGLSDLDPLLDDRCQETPEASPEHGLLKRELYRQVEDLLRELPPNWRHALVARFLREQPYEEIARKAGTTEANIRKRVQLARSFLRERLDEGGCRLVKRRDRRRR